MKCKEFHNKLASLDNIDQVTPEMRIHMENCASCRQAFQNTESLFSFIAEEKKAQVSPFINSQIKARIESQEAKPKIFRPALVTAMSIILIVLGFLSAGLFQNNLSITDGAEIIASEYYFSDNPGAQLEEIWINNYQDE